MQTLNNYPQWICWRAVWNDGRQKWDKIPVSPLTGKGASSTNPAEWADYKTACTYRETNKLDGLGFVLTARDPFFLYDLDGALQPDNSWSPLTQQSCADFQGAFVEVSHSGKGLHIIGSYEGERPDHGCKNVPLGIELYTAERFIAITGTNANGDAGTVHTAALRSLISRYFPAGPSPDAHRDDWADAPCKEWAGYEDDAQLIQAALNSGKRSAAAVFGVCDKVTFRDLWTGNTEAIARVWPSETDEYDRSSTDASLASHLAFWTGRNHERILRLMWQSKLVRDKWEQRGDYYLTRTILRACASCKDVHRRSVGAQVEAAGPIPDEPQPLFRELPSVPPYPVEALGPLRGAVEAVQGKTQAPVAIPAASALAVASLAVQGFANAETLGGDRPLSLYLLTIANSGERKSSCDAPLMEALRAFEKDRARDLRALKQISEDSQTIWKGQRDALLSKAKNADPSENAEIHAQLEALGPEPVAPASIERIVSEPTYEGLVKLFAAGQPSLGIFSDEGGQFLGGHAMNSENRQKTLAALNDLWQGSAIRRTRSGDGQMTLYDRRLAVHLMVQPIAAQKFMADRLTGDTGFLPRFLICEPPSKIGTRLHSNSRDNEAPITAFNTRLSEILTTQMPMDAETRELQPRKLLLDPDAKACLIAFADEIEIAQRPGDRFSDITAYASKAAEQAARIAGVLTLWRDLAAPSVTLEDMTYAVSLATYYLNEALRLTSAATISAEIEQAETLRQWLQENWPSEFITARDVVRLGPNSLRETKKVKAALAVLEQHGWVNSMSPGTEVGSKRHKESWRVIRCAS